MSGRNRNVDMIARDIQDADLEAFLEDTLKKSEGLFSVAHVQDYFGVHWDTAWRLYERLQDFPGSKEASYGKTLYKFGYEHA